MPLTLQSINHVINSHMLYTNPLKLYQHNPVSQVLPSISELAWREHVAWNLLFRNHTMTYSESFLNIQKDGHK